MDSPGEVIEVVLGDAPPTRLDKALAVAVPEAAALSRSRLARLIAAGHVSRDGRALTDPKAKVAAGDVIRVAVPPPEPMDLRPEPIALSIVHEDADLVVIDKPAGLVVHPAPGSRTGTLVHGLLHHFAGDLSGIGGALRPGIVHRIDKDTSGLIVVAKSDAAHHGLARQFEDHSAERSYLALCHGVPDAGDPRLMGLEGVAAEAGGVIRLATRIGRHPGDRQKQAVLPRGGRHAVTRLRVAEGFGAAALVECRLETGRTHQIRVHMTHAGHALIGDALYGGRRRASAGVFGPDLAARIDGFPRQALHAATLGFVHPATGAALSFRSDMPADMAALLHDLRGVDA